VRPLLVYGTRPNFVKIAPIYREMQRRDGIDPVLVHTGQHFDAAVSADVIEALELPTADIHLEVGPGTQPSQIATIMTRLEPVYEKVRPDCTIVVGDVSSTLAAALVSDILGAPVAHVEAGLRSFNWSMPEERNRVLTDRLSRWLFAPSADAVENLANEGTPPERIHLVGNVMIDSLDWVMPRLDIGEVRQRYGVADTDFGLVTLHRAGNVDDDAVLAGLLAALSEIAQSLPLLFAVHPRTQQRLEASKTTSTGGLSFLPPMPYTDFIALMSAARLVLTDSGGIQEEAVVLGTPCLTLREETERPITLTEGRNEVVGLMPAAIVKAASARLTRPRSDCTPFRPPLWDGHTAERIVAAIVAGLL
jgi:UDP-N-acetylglucosamine 2-epimerase (non-hydrolysing)